MRCPQCGHVLAPDAHFCSECGAAVTAAPVVAAPSAAAPLVALAVGGVVLLGAVVVGGYWLGSRSATSATPVATASTGPAAPTAAAPTHSAPSPTTAAPSPSESWGDESPQVSVVMGFLDAMKAGDLAEADMYCTTSFVDSGGIGPITVRLQDYQVLSARPAGDSVAVKVSERWEGAPITTTYFVMNEAGELLIAATG